MAEKTANVNDVDALYGFSSTLSSIGSNLVSDASRVSSAATSKISDLRGKLNQIENRYRETQEEYENALRDLQDAIDDYDYYISSTDPEHFSSSTADSLSRYVSQCRSAANMARDVMRNWEGRYESGKSAFQCAEQSLITLRGIADSFSMTVSADVDRASDNVRDAARYLSLYLDNSL